MKTRVALAAFALLLLPAAAGAVPLVVTGGTASTLTEGFGGRYNLTGANFTMTGGTGSGMPFGSVAPAGGTLNFGVRFTGLDFTGTAVIDGTAYIIGNGVFQLAGTLVIPFDAPTTGTFTVTAPFTLTGNFQGCTTNNTSINPCAGTLINAELTGQGLATVMLGVARVNAGGTAFYSVQRATYEFAPAAVPEPATLLLLATGLGGAALKARRRRKV